MTTMYLKFDAPAPEPGEQPAPTGYCVDNIGPQGRRVRMRFGWLAFLFGAALAAALLLLGVDGWPRLVVYLPFAVAGVNWRQALEKTWVSLAARGARDLDDGEQRVEDSAERRQIRRQALGVIVRGSLIGLALTAVVLLVP